MAVPIVPIVANVLSLGIPFIVDAVNRGKGKRQARKASAKAADVIANVQLGAGVLTGAADAGIGQLALAPGDLGLVPEWMQVTYIVSVAVGLIMKVLAARMDQLAETTTSED